MKPWKIFLIHHSHTDIGYTERQEKLTRYHVDFIRQAMDILDEIHAGKLPAEGFRWQCENIWQLDNFYANATQEDIARFEKYVRSGEIGVSGNYLNMTEMVDWDVLLTRTQKAKAYAEKIGCAIDSGMSADVNGYAWGYPDALSMSGVNNLFCALHPHHGMFPMGKKHFPFLWEGPKGGQVLTWVGEHYHFGNELGFSPEASSSYMVRDDRRVLTEMGKLYTTDAAATKREEEETLVIRLTRYLEALEKDGYPYDFVPFMVSGTITDNAPPSAAIVERANFISKAMGIQAEMSTLHDFFAYVRENVKDIPVCRGDFADWWADGIGSTANTVKVCRDAQRRYDLCRKLDPDNKEGSAALMEEAAQNVMMYAEHTWGYSSSISEPWDSLVALLEKRKDAFAINASNAAAHNLDDILAKRGEVTIQAHRPQRFKVINPHKEAFDGIVKLSVEFWEFVNGVGYDLRNAVIITDAATGEKLPAQGHRIARAYEVEVAVHLEPGEEKILLLTQNTEKNATLRNYPYVGADGIEDLETGVTLPEMPCLLETNYFRVNIEPGKGIVGIIDKATGKNIVEDGRFGAFSGLYEVTPAGELSQCEVRRRMGRKRRCMSTQQDVARLTNAEVIESGDVHVTAKLTYSLAGCHFYYVYLKLYKHSPILEARVCFHKKSEWDPENLYVMLPFVTDGSNETYIDKTGCIMRPGIDQLPQTCQDFWALQNGIIRKGDKRDLIIACKDAPLVSFGELKYAPTVLCNGDSVELNRSVASSWVLNNYWETNFKADLGGFYEFTYTVESAVPAPVDEEMERSRDLNEGALGFYY